MGLLSKSSEYLDYRTGNSDSISKDHVKIYNSGKWASVKDVDNGDLKLEVTLPDGKTSVGFEAVRNAKAYYPTFGTDGSFTEWNVGNINNIATGDEVAMFQVSKNSSGIDVVIYVKNGDIKDAKSEINDFTTAQGKPIKIVSDTHQQSDSKPATLTLKGEKEVVVSPTGTVSEDPSVADGESLTLKASGSTGANVNEVTIEKFYKHGSGYKIKLNFIAKDDFKTDLTVSSSNGATFASGGVAPTQTWTKSGEANNGESGVSSEITVTGSKEPQITVTLTAKGKFTITPKASMDSEAANGMKTTSNFTVKTPWAGDKVTVPVSFNAAPNQNGIYTVSVVDGSNKVITSAAVKVENATKPDNMSLTFKAEKDITDLHLKLDSPKTASVAFTDTVFTNGTMKLSIDNETIEGNAGSIVSVHCKLLAPKGNFYRITADKDLKISGVTSIAVDDAGKASGELKVEIPTESLTGVTLTVTAR